MSDGQVAPTRWRASLNLIQGSGIGFVDVNGSGWRLIGSGALLAYGSSRVILTSADVAAELPRTGQVGLALRTDLNRISVPASDLSVETIAIPSSDATALRLGCVRLGRATGDRLAGLRRFVELAPGPCESAPPLLETRSARMVTHGFTARITMTELPLDCFDMIYNFTSCTLVYDQQSDAIVAGGNLLRGGQSADRDEPPADLNGMRGGAVWSVPPDADAQRAPRLLGVVGRQHDAPASLECVCHPEAMALIAAQL